MAQDIQAHSIKLLAIGLLLVSVSALGADKLTVSTGITYLSGDYGQASATEIVYIPVTLKKTTGPWALKLTVPYLRITGPGGVLPELGPVGSATATGAGLGDILASATYRAYYNAKQGVLVNVTGKVKIPTADRHKGLGTGKADFYGQADVYRISGPWIPFFTLGYKVIGDTATTDFNNVAYGAMGVSYKLSDRTSVGARAYARQRTTASNDPRKELTLFASNKLTKTWKLQGYTIKGFSNASPDWGVGASVGYDF